MRYKTILTFARQMRANPTPAEDYFWKKVLNRSFHDYKFYRQYIIETVSFNGDKNFFIVDFYCHHNKLIIELDGKIHLQQLEYDKLREEELITLGYNILRFKNEEILNNWDWVEIQILKKLTQSTTRNKTSWIRRFIIYIYSLLMIYLVKNNRKKKPGLLKGEKTLINIF
jgi:very-short-patch-repair endonuclease